MKPLAPLQGPRHILSFDFDGTLHDPASDPMVLPLLFGRLRALRVSHAAVWGVNTGRSLDYLLEGMSASDFPFLPDWIVAREREIYLWDDNRGWTDHQPWNRKCAEDIHQLFEREHMLLGRIRHEVLENTGAQWLEMEGEPAGLVSRTEEEMEWIVGQVEQLVDPDCALSWQRNSIYLRFSHRDYHKGSCLSETAGLFGLSAQHAFAVGDSHNDLEMLDAAHAGMTACPANALEPVRARVAAQGGLVGSAGHGAGVIEALDHYFGC